MNSNINLLRKRIKTFYVPGLLVLTIAFFTILSGGRFLRTASIINILRVSVPTLIISVTATLLMISGNVDLSVGGNLGLSACIFALLVQAGLPFFSAAIIVLLVGIGFGLLNGFFVMKCDITPVIATLAAMALFQGVGKLLVPDGQDIIKGGMPEGMNFFARGKMLLNLPPAVYAAIIITVLVVVFQKRSTLGKYTIAIGSNRKAAELSGINAVFIVWLLYALVGFSAALAGITRASYMQAGDPDSGIGVEVDAIIAILLGGTSFFGGEGSVLKTVAAVYILICLTKGLTMIGVEPFWSMLVKGIVFFAALILDNLISNESIKKPNLA